MAVMMTTDVGWREAVLYRSLRPPEFVRSLTGDLNDEGEKKETTPSSLWVTYCRDRPVAMGRWKFQDLLVGSWWTIAVHSLCWSQRICGATGEGNCWRTVPREMRLTRLFTGEFSNVVEAKVLDQCLYISANSLSKLIEVIWYEINFVKVVHTRCWTFVHLTFTGIDIRSTAHFCAKDV